MVITNIVVTDTGGGQFRIDFHTNANLGNVDRVYVDFGPTSTYGTEASAQIDGVGNCFAYLDSGKPFHFQCGVGLFSGGPDLSPDQLYPPLTPEPPSFDGFTVVNTGSTSNRLTWDASVTPSASFQVYRGTTNNLSAAIAIGAPLAPGANLYNDYAAAPGTTYYYWLVQVN